MNQLFDSSSIIATTLNSENARRKRRSPWIIAALTMVLTGCGGSDDAPKEIKAESNVIAGRVTMEDGSAPRGEIKDISISIYGVSEAAEKVNYSPAVLPDGSFKQKVAGGQYGFEVGRITVLYNGGEFTFPLEPVGNLWNKNRDAAEGIVQDFVWKVRGPTPYGKSDGLRPENATHWYGMSIGMRAEGWREDIAAKPPIIPEGSKLTFTLKPTGPTIDGQTIETLIVERTISSENSLGYDINDIPQAPYELTGTATLPDGTVKPLLLQSTGDYPNYKPMVQIQVTLDGLLGCLAKQPCDFLIE